MVPWYMLTSGVERTPHDIWLAGHADYQGEVQIWANHLHENALPADNSEHVWNCANPRSVLCITRKMTGAFLGARSFSTSV